MKYLPTLLFLLIFNYSAFARLGETEAQIEARYDTAVPVLACCDCHFYCGCATLVAPGFNYTGCFVATPPRWQPPHEKYLPCHIDIYLLEQFSSNHDLLLAQTFEYRIHDWRRGAYGGNGNNFPVFLQSVWRKIETAAGTDNSTGRSRPTAAS
jgi:hypothetical protein